MQVCKYWLCPSVHQRYHFKCYSHFNVKNISTGYFFLIWNKSTEMLVKYFSWLSGHWRMSGYLSPRGTNTGGTLVTHSMSSLDDLLSFRLLLRRFYWEIRPSMSILFYLMIKVLHFVLINWVDMETICFSRDW